MIITVTLHENKQQNVESLSNPTSGKVGIQTHILDLEACVPSTTHTGPYDPRENVGKAGEEATRWERRRKYHSPENEGPEARKAHARVDRRNRRNRGTRGRWELA